MRYIALTLGPINDTLALGHKTSEIWMASYIFSSFMKKVIFKIKNQGDANFLVPFTEDETIFQIQDDGIGMFHDRFIFQTKTLTIKDVQTILDEEKNALASMIAQSIKRDENKVQNFIKSYLQTYLLESEEKYENPIVELSMLLDSIELHTPHLEADEDYMKLFLNRDTILNSALAKESFGKKPSFDSIEAIAAQETDNKEAPKNAQPCIAIVHADGDNLGRYIKTQENVSSVSKKLFEFNQKAVQSIKDFGALPLFVGGDDLLFFSPVVNAKKETVFSLIEQLSQDYENALQTKESTLSFGVSVTYYKYPLYEALAKSREALFEVAKNYKEKNKEKNAVALSAQKQSGQSFDFCISKDYEAYEQFKNLAKKILAQNLELPHAVHHKLYKHKALFKNIGTQRIATTFENLFNEDIHQSKFQEGLQAISELFVLLGTQEQEKLFSMLSTIKLIRGDR